MYLLRDRQASHFLKEAGMRTEGRTCGCQDDGADGRYFLLFLSLILELQLYHTWKTTELHRLFSSTEAVLDEMRSIRCIGRAGGRVRVTSAVGKQADIVKAFGFDIPSDDDAAASQMNDK